MTMGITITDTMTMGTTGTTIDVVVLVSGSQSP